MCPKAVYLVILSNFEPSDPLKSPIYQQRSTPKCPYSPKSLHKFVLPENVFKTKFFEVKVHWKCPKPVYLVILSNFEPSDPLKSPIYQQKSTPKGPYSPKSLHKFVLPENVFKTIFFNVETLLKCPKVRVWGQNPQKFCQKRPIKLGKMHQIS